MKFSGFLYGICRIRIKNKTNEKKTLIVPEFLILKHTTFDSIYRTFLSIKNDGNSFKIYRIEAYLIKSFI